MNPNAESIPLPFLTVVIPTRNRPRQIRQCLDSLAEQSYPRDRWEAIVVVDGEDCPVLDSAEWPGAMQLRSIRQRHSGCGIARNAGASLAGGEFLIFTDDDCLFPADWLSRYAKCIRRHPACLVAGRSVNGLVENPYSQTTQDIIDYLLALGNPAWHDAALAIGNNFGVPAKAFRELAGFSVRYFRSTAEDREFSARWRASGRRIIFAPEVMVEHVHHLTWCSFLEQHYRYGRGAWLLHHRGSDKLGSDKLGSDMGGQKIGRQEASYYGALLHRPFVIYRGLRAWGAFALLLLSQAAHSAGYASAYFSRFPSAPKAAADEMRGEV